MAGNRLSKLIKEKREKSDGTAAETRQKPKRLLYFVLPVLSTLTPSLLPRLPLRERQGQDQDIKNIDDAQDTKPPADVKAQCTDSGAEYVELTKARQKETEAFIALLPQHMSTELTRRLM